jgi:hypothetical protein
LSLTSLLLSGNEFGDSSKVAIRTAWLSKPGRAESHLHI